MRVENTSENMATKIKLLIPILSTVSEDLSENTSVNLETKESYLFLFMSRGSLSLRSGVEDTLS